MVRGLAIPIFQPGATPSRVLLRDLTGRCDRYQQSITAQGWFETMTCSFFTDDDDARGWLDHLMASTQVRDRDLAIIWEGYLAQVDVTMRGGVQYSASLEGVANRIYVRYTNSLGGNHRVGPVNDTASQAQFGVKAQTISSEASRTSTTATSEATRAVAARAWPIASVSVGDQRTAQATVQLSFKGWYTTLDWLTTSSSTTTTAVTTAQVASLLTTFQSTNAFFSTDQSLITASGLSSSQQIDPDTTYRAAIEARLALGNTNNQDQAWGVMSGRRFFVRQWAAYYAWDQWSDERRTHYRRQRDGQITDQHGGVIAPWRVTPDAVLLADRSPGPTLSSSAVERAGRMYIERVTCDVTATGATVRLEPRAERSLARRVGSIT